MKKFQFTVCEDSAPLFEQLKTAIQKFLQDNKFKPGDKLPSENEFCANSSVSIRTVRRALVELERDGVLIRRQGRGTFLAEVPTSIPERRTVGIIFSDIAHVTNPVFLELLHAMEEEIARHGWNFHLYASGTRDEAALPLAQILPQELPDALIATSALNQADLHWLKEQKIALCAFNTYRDCRINSVRFDYAQAALTGLDFLAQRGIKKVVALLEHSGNPHDAVIYGHEIFRQAALLHATELQLDFSVVNVAQNRPAGAQVAAELAKNGAFPEAFITFTPLVAEGILAFEREMHLPHAVLLCCHAAPSTGATALLKCDLGNMGRQAVKIVAARLAGDPALVTEKLFQLKLQSLDSNNA